MNEETHKLLLSMGFFQHDTYARSESLEDYHSKHEITLYLPPEPSAADVCDKIFEAGRTVQKALSKATIIQAAKFLGFDFLTP